MTYPIPPGLLANYGLEKNLVTSLNSSGAATDFIRNENSGVLVIIRQLSLITSPQANGVTCVISPPVGIMDTSYFAGTGDTAIGEYLLRAGSFLKLVYSNGPANGTAIATYYYDEVYV